MSELTPYEGRQPTALTRQAMYADAAVARLAEWASSATAAYEVARRLVGTSFAPVAYRGKPEEATAAILAGSEVGLSPMAALRAFDIISGQAAPRALTLRAIVQSQGHQIELIESTSTRCRMRGKRRDATDWQSVTWTMDRARELGLAGKDPWRKQPAAMLQARATSELARLIAADAILGIAFSAEEAADADPTLGVEVVTDQVGESQPRNGTRRLSRPKQTPPASEEGPPPLSQKQQQHLHALLTDLGVEDRDQRLRLVSDILGRELESSKDLTSAEASIVIDDLKAKVAQLPATDEDEPLWPQVAEPGEDR